MERERSFVRRDRKVDHPVPLPSPINKPKIRPTRRFGKSLASFSSTGKVRGCSTARLRVNGSQSSDHASCCSLSPGLSEVLLIYRDRRATAGRFVGRMEMGGVRSGGRSSMGCKSVMECKQMSSGGRKNIAPYSIAMYTSPQE